MGYLGPHFEPDLFVSYSHGDPKGRGSSPLKTWTQALVRRLEAEIMALADVDFDDLDVFVDHQLDPTEHITPALRERASKSGVFLIVMSKRYLRSAWCKDELDWFIKGRADDLGRVFVVRAQPTDAELWPQALRDERGHQMPGFWFYDRDVSGDGDPLGWPDLSLIDESFLKEFKRLKSQIVRKLEALRDRAPPEPPQAAATPAPTNGPRRIYLHAGAESKVDSEAIRAALQPEGIESLSILPTGDRLAQWRRGDAARMEAAKRCEAMALLRPPDDDRFVGDLLDIGVDECRSIAAARGTPFPCAVLDLTGRGLPLDVSRYPIRRFDVTQDRWRGEFRAWLDAARQGAAP